MLSAIGCITLGGKGKKGKKKKKKERKKKKGDSFVSKANNDRI